MHSFNSIAGFDRIYVNMAEIFPNWLNSVHTAHIICTKFDQNRWRKFNCAYSSVLKRISTVLVD
jgi:hypothetical protein